MVQITSDKIRLKGFAESRQGGRAENQDDWGFAETPLGFLAIVCDGMGGGPGGKTASGVAKAEIIRGLQQTTPGVPVPEAIREAVRRADTALKMRIQQDQRLAGMGTTFVALLVNAEAAYVAHAGDSRCYRLQGGRIMFRTADHSLVGELVRSKALTEEQARTSPQANLITRGLGSVNNSLPDVDVVPYRAGNRFVLCTDGVWGMMNQVELVGKFRALRNLQTDVPRLCDEIDRLGFRQGGRHDNHTLIVVDVEANSQLKDGLWSAEGLKGLAKGKWKWVMGAAGGLTLCLMVGVGIAIRQLWGVDETQPDACVAPSAQQMPELRPWGEGAYRPTEDPLPTDDSTQLLQTETSGAKEQATDSTATQAPLQQVDTDQAQRLKKIAQKVKQLLDLKCETEKEAVDKSAEMVERIGDELKAFQHVCDSLNERSLYPRLKVVEISIFFKNNRAQAMRVMKREDASYVPSYDAQHVLRSLQQRIKFLGETKGEAKHAD